MKQMKKNLMALVAMLLAATGLWAAGTVTIVKQLDGVVNDAAGTVTQSISEASGLCTLTVTPAEGNYVTAEDVTAEKTVDGSGANARRRAPGVSEPLDVTFSGETVNLTGANTFTFQMPAAEYDVEVVVNFHARTSIAGAVINLLQPDMPFIYNGEEQFIEVSSVVLNPEATTALSEDDYSVTYENNINAGEATVKVTGEGFYTGEATTTFTIQKAPLYDMTVTIDDWGIGETPSTPVVEGNLGEGAVTFTYRGINEDMFSATVPSTIGTYQVMATVAETTNYEAGEATGEFSIYRSLPVSFSETVQWATYYGSEDLNVPSGLIAYAVTGLNQDANEVSVQELRYIPANTPVLLANLKFVEGPFNAYAYDGDPMEYETGDLLKGLSAATSVAAVAKAEENAVIYVLYNNEFVKTTSGTIPANRCYLSIPLSQGQVAPARLGIVIGDETTGIENLTPALSKGKGAIYNLNGQRIATPRKGLYIVNGKKVVVK